MYFPSTLVVLTGLSSLTSAVTAYDDGMYHPDTTAVYSQTPTSVYSQTSTPVYSQATTYLAVDSDYTKSTWYPTLTKSTYVGYWSGNATTTTSYKQSTKSATTSTTTYTTLSNNMTMTMRLGNVSNTMTMTDRVYTTTICDFQSSCITTVATATGGMGQVRTTASEQPTMTPFSSSDRLIASGWCALALCGIALLL